MGAEGRGGIPDGEGGLEASTLEPRASGHHLLLSN